ncbi:MAG: hypothetical protein J6C30_06965 [Lentisphaeria bacterium]|nr:hypothetical protein [Lentisphaeria bacterium]
MTPKEAFKIAKETISEEFFLCEMEHWFSVTIIEKDMLTPLPSYLISKEDGKMYPFTFEFLDEHNIKFALGAFPIDMETFEIILPYSPYIPDFIMSKDPWVREKMKKLEKTDPEVRWWIKEYGLEQEYYK